MRAPSGFTLIELLIAVAVAGVLMGIGAVALKPQRFAVNQAAQVMVSAVTQARFEAIKENRTSYLTLDTSGDGSYSICVDEDESATCDTGEVTDTRAFGTDDLAKARLSATTLSPARIEFDPRGIPRGALSGKTITITATSGSYARTVEISATGKASIQ